MFKRTGRYFSVRLTVSLIVITLMLLICGISGIIDSASFSADVMKNYDNGVGDINIMTDSQYKNKMNVYGDILYIYDAFCEETSTNTYAGIETSTKVTATYYLMPISSENQTEEMYITVVTKSDEATKAFDEIMDDTWDFLDGKDVTWHDYYFFGKVKPLEADVEPYLLDWFRETDFFETDSEAEIMKHVIPYEIVEYNPSRERTVGIACLAGGLAIIAIAAVIFMIVRKRQNQIPAPMPDFAQPNNSFPQNNLTQPASPDAFFNDKKPAQPSAPVYPEIKQPVSPDDFFAPKKAPAPAEEAPTDTFDDSMGGLDTGSLNLDALDTDELYTGSTGAEADFAELDAGFLPDDASYEENDSESQSNDFQTTNF